MALHKDIPYGCNHIIHSLEYANEAARTGATGLDADDVGRVAAQLDNDTFWLLTDYSPVTWIQLGVSTDLDLDDLGDVDASSPVSGQHLEWDGSNWVSATPTELIDEKVKISSNDTTPGYLIEKLTTTSGLEITELNDSGDEDLHIALDVNGLPEDTDPNCDDDYMVVYDTSAGVHKKVILANLPAPAVGAYGTGTYLCSPFSWSNPVPLGVCTFQTIAGMHDPTNHDTGTALGSQTSTTLQDTSKSWTVNEYATYSIRITGGTGVGQWRTISSNTSNTITIGTAWDTTPDGTSTYEISRSSRLIVPKAGIYNITAHCSFQAGTGAFGIAILQNGTFRSVTHIHNTVVAELTPGNTRFLNLEEDDYIEMKVWNGYTGTLLMNSGALRLYLEMNRVGG